MSDPGIHLGFKVGTGDRVAIPLKHLAICGQTQEAGKTTALEALITRSKLRAVTFITKRGEASFTNARRTAPYFREQADWQFVASILEASRGEKLKFERAWIIRASKGARTLADVQHNVRTAMEKARGMSADVYLTLDAYLDQVVPTIARVEWAPRLEIQPGVNAVDLTAVPAEMQHLVIKSCIEWVLEREKDTVVVVPEAWKFIPQGRGTPVKLAAEAFIRQAASLKNFLWLDSQDIGGIEKTILRSVPVWVLGVQREANEIDRTLSNIPAGVSKPSKSDIATLRLGQFFACWGRHAIKTYVQPEWLDEDAAIQIASLDRDPPTRPRAEVADDRASPGGRPAEVQPRSGGSPGRPTGALGAVHRQEDRAMKTEWQHRGVAIKLREDGDWEFTVDGTSRVVDSLRNARGLIDDLARRTGLQQSPTPKMAAAEAPVWGWGDQDDALYQRFKARLLAEAQTDPAILSVITRTPELVVNRERAIIEEPASTFLGRVAAVVGDGYLADTRTSAEIKRELERTGNSVNNKNLSIALAKLVELRIITREDGGFRVAPGAKVRIVER